MAGLYRYFSLERGKASKENRSVEMVFSTEFPVARMTEEGEEYDEILSHDADDADLSRLKDSAPLLFMHNLNRQLGVIEGAEIDGNRQGRATSRFSQSDEAEQIFKDVLDGIRKHVSVGYDLTGIASKSKGEDGRQKVRFKWRPFEISIVSAPEDPNTGIGRMKRSLLEPAAEVNAETQRGKDAEGLLVRKFRAADYQVKALDECIAALNGVLGGQGLTDKARAACRVALTACEGCRESFTPGSADVCWEECYEACQALRGLGDGYGAACVALCACAEMCWQVLASNNRTVDGAKLKKRNLMRLLFDPTATAGGGANPSNTNPTPPAPSGTAVVDIQVREKAATDGERTRVKRINAAITALAGSFPGQVEKFRALANTAIEAGTSSEDFNAQLLREIPGVTRQNPITMASIGMNAAEQEEYSIGRALRSMVTNKGRVEGLEAEVHQAMSQQKIGVEPEGLWVPFDAAVRVKSMGARSLLRRGQRDLNVGTFGQGGALVATILQVPIIELLRNRMVCERLGVQSLSGLQGNVAIPRQTGAAQAYAVPESGALTKSTQALDQIGLTPHRVGAWNDYTRQLLLQSSIDVENFIRDDIMKVLAIKWDYLILQGAGANDEPLGIMNVPGIGSVNFGATATWAKVIAFETALAVANADAGNMAYVTSPSVRGAWKGTAKIGTTFPIFIWESGNWNDGSNDGLVNGYRAAATNQILNNTVAFGNWEDQIGPALWGGFDFVVNPYTLDTQGEVRVTCNTYGDVATRHAQSFCWSQDAGNQ